MTIVFTEEELTWINKAFNHWTIKDNCPAKIRKAIQTKIDVLYSFPDKINNKQR